MERVIAVWMCPHPDCENYYASSSQEHLDLNGEPNYQADTNHTLWGGTRVVVSHRGDCPDCKRTGRGTVKRVRVRVAVPVPAMPASVEVTELA